MYCRFNPVSPFIRRKVPSKLSNITGLLLILLVQWSEYARRTWSILWLLITPWFLVSFLQQPWHMHVRLTAPCFTKLSESSLCQKMVDNMILYIYIYLKISTPRIKSFRKISFDIGKLPFEKIHFKMSTAKWRPFCSALSASCKTFFLYRTS